MQSLFKLTDTQLHMSSSYHPQSDGQIERLNQCLEAFFRCIVQPCPKQWSKWLPLAEFWYNTSYHTALGRTPFEVLYGHPLRHFGITNADVCHPTELDEWLSERRLLNQVIQQQLTRASHRMKQQADRHRSEREFEIGDMVYLKVQPSIQTTVANRANQKLAYKYFGPFKILQRIGSVAYKLDLPATAKTHSMIHVSQLKRHVPPSVVVSEALIDPASVLQPIHIVDSRLTRTGTANHTELLVQWAELPKKLMT